MIISLFVMQIHYSYNFYLIRNMLQNLFIFLVYAIFMCLYMHKYTHKHPCHLYQQIIYLIWNSCVSFQDHILIVHSSLLINNHERQHNIWYTICFIIIVVIFFSMHGGVWQWWVLNLGTLVSSLILYWLVYSSTIILLKIT